MIPKLCPHCQIEPDLWKLVGGSYRVECPRCGKKGGIAPTMIGAITEWEKGTTQRRDTPL